MDGAARYARGGTDRTARNAWHGTQRAVCMVRHAWRVLMARCSWWVLVAQRSWRSAHGAVLWRSKSWPRR